MPLVMDQGKRIASGEPQSVLHRPTHGRLARLVGVENLLRMTVREHREQDGITLCTGNGVDLAVPLVDAKVGEEITVGIRADDIILATSEPTGLSARNRLRGTVTEVASHGSGCRVVLDCGVLLACHVTRRAVEELGIRPGATLWAVLKASSCFVLV